MPALRERRAVKHPQRFVATNDKVDARWTLDDKKKLLQGLEKYHEDDVAKIQVEFLPRKTCSQLTIFINKMKHKAQSRQQHLPQEKLPIELWCEMVKNLTATTNDLSNILAEVFMKIEKNEMHDAKMTREAPDWMLIYNYLVVLLQGHEPPIVGQIEAAVLLDLLEALAHHISQLDIINQRRLMQAKYSLLATEVDNTTTKQKVYELARHALEDDVLEAANQTFNNSVSSQHKANLSTSTSSVPPVKASTATIETATNHLSNVSSTNQVQPSSSLSSVDTESPGQHPGNGQEQQHHGAGSRNGGECETEQVFVIRPMKLPLYTINPLCVPVKYLNPRPVRTGGTTTSTSGTSLVRGTRN